jgi:hypothetical protein
MAKLVLPRAQAMVLCDEVEESDEEEGTHHLTGVRSKIQVPSFPSTRRRLCVFLQMSGHEGDAICRLEVHRLATDERIYRTSPRPISFQDPVLVVPVIYRLRNCEFPAPGVYYVQIFHENKMIGERPLHLVEEE